MSLVVSELYKKYGNKVVVDHLSFEMKEPGVYALLGTNGAGKRKDGWRDTFSPAL